MLKKSILHLKNLDWVILLSITMLTAIGLLFLYGEKTSGSGLSLFNRQLISYTIGLGLLLLFSFLNYRFFKNFTIILYTIGILLMIAVLIWGKTIRGTTGWFRIFGFGFQPVEFMKLVLVFALSSLYYSYQTKKGPISLLAISGIVSAIPIILVLMQPDLGSAFVLFVIWSGFFALINMKKKHLIIFIILFAIAGIALWNFVLVDYQKHRIITFVNPEQDLLGEGYNVHQSIIAIGSGQIYGRGFDAGSQSQLHFLPEAETDFIFAATSENLGFLGSSLILILFSLLFFRMLSIMKKAKDTFGLYLIYGFGLIFFTHCIINIGMNLGILPVTGISLPFVSYGGSFLITSLIAIGIIQNINIKTQT